MPRALDADLWAIDHAFVVGGLHMGLRTTIVRLPDGGLWLHSPGPVAEHADAIRALGPVKHVVAPNRLHDRFLGQAHTLFPEATVWAAPGLREKSPGLPPGETLGDAPPEAWASTIDQHLVQGAPDLQEVVFLHRPSRTLVLTDVAFNLTNSDSIFTRWAMWANGAYGRFGPSRLMRWVVTKDARALGGSIERILRWDFDRVIVTHGAILETGGREALRDGFSWATASS